jgi:hypothetical protein
MGLDCPQQPGWMGVEYRSFVPQRHAESLAESEGVFSLRR